MGSTDGTMRGLAGRKAELEALGRALAEASAGKGRAVIVTGEPGIGKTRLVDEFLGNASGARILRGHAVEGDVRPFGAFSEALADVVRGDLFQEEEYTGFGSVFLINDSGMLLAKSSADSEDMDADIFAGMLSAVQNFVADSFDSAGQDGAGLGKLVYGDMTIMMEHAPGMFITAVAGGREHPGMRQALADAAQGIRMSHGKILASWTGNMSELRGLQADMDRLAAKRFLVRKDLEGVKFENERLRIAENAVSHIDRLSRSGPVILLIEDIHWADESTHFLFPYLARNIAGCRVLLMATARNEGGQSYARFRKSAAEEGIVTEMPLGGLDPEGVKALAGNMFPPNDFPEDFVMRLARDSVGNPLFIGETLRQMHDDGGIIFERGTFSLSKEDYVLPKGVEEIVRRRLGTLDAEPMAMAEYATCIGLEFGIADLASLGTFGSPEGTAESLVKSGVFARRSAGFGFSHAMFRQVTYDDISERWKTAFHRSLGEHIERTRETRGGDAIYELARHFSACGENAKALRYLLEAGERAEGAYAADLAREFYSTALGIIPKLGPELANEALRGEILEKLADSERRVGAIKEAAEDYGRAIPLLEGDRRLAVTLKAADAVYLAGELERGKDILGTVMPPGEGVGADLATHMLARYGLMCAKAGFRDMAAPYAESALEKLESVEQPAVRVRVLTMLGNTFDILDQEERSQAMLRKAVDEAEASRDLDCLAAAYSEIGYHMHFAGEHGAASKLLEKATAYMEKRGDMTALSHGLVTLGMAYSDCGELEKSLASLRRALGFVRKIGNMHHMASILGNTGYTLAMMGRHDESLAYQKESLELRRKIGSEGGMAWSYIDMSMVYLQQGKLDMAADCIIKSADLFEKVGDTQGLCMAKSTLAEVRRFQGDNAAAVSLYKEALEIAEQKSLNRMKFGILKDLVELGAAEPVGALAELEALAKKLVYAPTNMRLLELRGNLAAAAGDSEAALRHYGAGLEIATGRNIDDDLAAGGLLARRAGLHLKEGRSERAGEDAGRAGELYLKWGRLREAKAVESLAGE